MGAITSAVVAIAAVILGWITIEIACKPCLKDGRDAIDRALNPNYDPDATLIPQNRTPADAADTTTAQPLLRDEPPASSAPPAAKIT